MRRTLALLAILSSFALGQFATRAEVVWKDGTTTTVQEGSTVIVRKCALTLTPDYFRLLNQGNPDPTPGSQPRPEPEFISALTMFLPADRVITLGSVIGAAHVGGGRWEVVQPTDWKQTANYPTDTFPEYAACATHHVIEGGKSLYVETAPIDDPWRTADLTPTAAQVAEALRIMDVNWSLLWRQQNFYSHYFLNLVKYDAKSTDPTIPVGKHNIGFLLDPNGFVKRWSPSYTFGSVANLWMAGTKEGGVSNRVEFYDCDAAWMIGGCLTGDLTTKLVGRHLFLGKVQHGFLNCEQSTSRKKHRWAGEHGTGGLLGDADAKQWDLSTALFHALWPNDPIGTEVYTKRLQKNRTNPIWNGGGGARNFGNNIKNAWYMHLASGDPVIKAHAAWEIDDTFTKWIGSKNFIEDNQGSGTVGHGETALTLHYCFKWYVDGQIGSVTLNGSNGMPNWNGATFDQRHPNFRQKLDDMLTWLTTYSATYLDQAHTWARAHYRTYNCTNTSGTGNQQGDLQGIFWTGLSQYATTTAQTQMLTAVERLTFGSSMSYWANPITNLGADLGSQGPGWCKWIQGIAAGSALK